MLKRVLTRRAANRMKVQKLEEAAATMIETALDQLVDLGLLNDETYAIGRVSSLKQKGLSKRRVSLMMQVKGLDRQTIAIAIGDELDDLTQARRFAERKRLGPWRSSVSTSLNQPDRDRKDLRILQRAGFPYAIAKAALAGE
jgi:regulatory protein